MEGNIIIYRLRKDHGTDQWEYYCPSKTAKAISFPPIRSMNKGQSVYPDLDLHISKYCIYCDEVQNQTKTI